MSVTLQVIISQFLIVKVLSAYVQPQLQPQLLQQFAIKPYATKESIPVQTPPKPYPEYKAYYQPNYPPVYPNIQYQKPETAPPRPIVPEVTVPIKTEIEKPLTKCPSNLDAHVLNNLAIALQLLIVNNIISNPPQEINTPLAQVLELAYPEQALQIPNSKFLGASNFGDMPKGLIGVSSLGATAISPTRSGITLMSPYDAIANSVPISESLTSSYLAKKDFQSPYAAIMAADNNQELFTMSDFY